MSFYYSHPLTTHGHLLSPSSSKPFPDSPPSTLFSCDVLCHTSALPVRVPAGSSHLFRGSKWAGFGPLWGVFHNGDTSRGQWIWGETCIDDVLLNLPKHFTGGRKYAKMSHVSNPCPLKVACKCPKVKKRKEADIYPLLILNTFTIFMWKPVLAIKRYASSLKMITV